MSQKNDYESIPLVSEGGGPPPSSGGGSNRMSKQAFVAEVFGTATLVQIGCGANCVAIYIGGLSGMWQTGVLWMLGASMGIYASAAQSGGHLNPAVTLAFALVRPDAFPMQQVLPYWAAQLLGAIIAAFINTILFTTMIDSFEAELKGDSLLTSAAAFGDYWSVGRKNVTGNFHATVVEAFGTAFLCFCIFWATNPKTKVPKGAVPALVGVAIGLMVALLGPLTGAGINPARDMGPRLVTLVGHWGKESMTNWFPYFIGPLIGGPIGAFLADKVLLM